MTLRPLVFALAAALALPLTAQAAKYTYHGDLMDGDAPAEGAYDLRVRAFAQPGATKTLGEATELPGVKLSGGRFSVELDLPEDADGTTWVEVAVRKAGSNDPFEKLGDPQPIAKANSTCPGAWALDGNTSVPPGSFLGLADPANLDPLVLKAGNVTVGQFKPELESNVVRVVSVQLGSPLNVASGYGATVGGGGNGTSGAMICNFCRNEANSSFATVGGGSGVRATGPYATASGGNFNTAGNSWSTVGGGMSNSANKSKATVSGGQDNRADGDASVIAGGERNATTGALSVIGGGISNETRGFSSAVTGGQANAAMASYSTAGGGLFNCAGGNYAWAGGRRAKVRAATAGLGVNACYGFGSSDTFVSGDADGDEGTFVWADATDANFVSSGPNQFLVRAGGGVGINTASLGTARVALAVAPRASDAVLNSIQLRTSTKSSEWTIHDPSGETTLDSSNGNLLLSTSTAGKYIHTNDRLGVKRLPSANVLEVEGDASKNTAGAWLANSDRRIKTGIAPIPDALDTILKLRPVTFRYDDAYRKAHDSIGDQRYYNVIAQEFAEVFPGAVKGSGEYLPGKPQSKDNEILQVDTYPAQIVTIAAVQELAALNLLQDEELATLRRDVSAVRSQNALLAEQVEQLLSRLRRSDDQQGQ